MRNRVLDSMSDPDGSVKLLFATEAYSMGTDAPDVRRVVHAGVPTTLESMHHSVTSLTIYTTVNVLIIQTPLNLSNFGN
jgi:hypothetical protein